MRRSCTGRRAGAGNGGASGLLAFELACGLVRQGPEEIEPTTHGGLDGCQSWTLLVADKLLVIQDLGVDGDLGVEVGLDAFSIALDSRLVGQFAGCDVNRAVLGAVAGGDTHGPILFVVSSRKNLVEAWSGRHISGDLRSDTVLLAMNSLSVSEAFFVIGSLFGIGSLGVKSLEFRR